MEIFMHGNAMTFVLAIAGLLMASLVALAAKDLWAAIKRWPQVLLPLLLGCASMIFGFVIYERIGTSLQQGEETLVSLQIQLAFAAAALISLCFAFVPMTFVLALRLEQRETHRELQRFQQLLSTSPRAANNKP